MGPGVDAPMAQRSPPPFDPSHPPIIEGFTATAIQRREEEGFRGKFQRKIRENPIVPLGCLCTAGALTYGLICFKKGNNRRSQLLMRTRIVAQGFTVFALLAGVAFTALTSKQ